LALAARAVAYGERIVYQGPTYKSMTIRGNRALIDFDNVAGGLIAKGGPLTGFTIAGEDGKFRNSRAVIVGNRVVVSHPEVNRPTAVRHGWANYPVVNLYNLEGLPASPFRTDNTPKAVPKR
jgi:sialate O-acetylesterase